MSQHNSILGGYFHNNFYPKINISDKIFQDIFYAKTNARSRYNILGYSS